ncbi:MAG: TonB-dependent receptor [Dysgonamonadaceae bacterium]|jgi:hypothetical protein|nr:TonB-dependent receptor [Dysgonamonadaceae bacterium]
MVRKSIFIIFLSILAHAAGFAKQIKISGTVSDSEGLPLEIVNVQVKNSANGTYTDAKGRFSLTLNVADSCTLVFTCLGYNKVEQKFTELSQDLIVNVKMRVFSYELEGVTVTGSRRLTNNMETIQTGKTRLAADATGGSVESFVMTAGTGVSSTNELSTQYSVRGGNYNENMVYVNGVEIYRPILIRSGQQEGLSFINPDLTADVSFSSGGFEARYGDKMSSVLNVNYKKPEAFEAGVSGSMLGGSAYVGNASGRFSQITGLRYKRGTTLLKTLDTKGDYNPSAIDFQTFINYAILPKLNLSLMGNYSENTYDFNPSTRETSWGTMDTQKNFTVWYGGAERDRFRTAFGAATLKYDISDNADIALQISAFQSTEEENYDISGDYWMSNVVADDEEITGVGSFMEHARNYLKSRVMNASLSGSLGVNRHTVRWSAAFQKENITDRIKEWQLQDSMGYSLPQSENSLRLANNLLSQNEISSNRISGYLQDTYKFRIEKGIFSLTAGLRGSYWDFNREFILSPRASLGFIPSKNQNLNFRFASGLYYQAPFYKEFRMTVEDEDGNQHIELNKDIKSQRSIHFVLGGDYNFKYDNRRPFKFTTELYYKKMDRLVPYTVNNVRIQYYGMNVSDGYSAGIDLKLFGQFVPETDSWVSFSLMRARQRIDGQLVPMPTDQLYNFSLFFTDYFPSYKRIEFNLRAIIADGLPFSVPGNEYKNGVRTPMYRRVDMGFTYRLLDENDEKRRYSAWKYFKNIWLGVDFLNLLDIKNVSSYSWFSDINRNQYAVPDRLTGRQINFKFVAEF